MIEGSREEAARARWTLAGEAFDVLTETDRLVSPLTVTVEDWSRPEDFSNPVLLRNVRRNGMPL